MPTFGSNARQVEAHLVEFDGDLYGKTIQVELVDWLREQRKFNGLEALKAQLGEDIEASRKLREADPARVIAHE